MKNLKPYQQNCFDIHKKAIESKHDVILRESLSLLNTDIEKLYLSFEEKFKINNLESLTAFTFTPSDREGLLSLYDYQRFVIRKIKVDLTTTETGHIQNTCPYCTIGEVGTLDHYIPKIEFAEFVVNPKNLFPCCSKCNSYKSKMWRKEGKRYFLNLYLDNLPDLQYLFVKINFEVKKWEIDFEVLNKNTLNTTLFELIKNHYQELDLCTRFKENCDEVVANLVDAFISSIEEGLDFEQTKAIETNRIKKSQLKYGANYWKDILKIELIDNDKFKRYVTSKK